MPLDSDLIRVDLLLVKRKIYLSLSTYKERQDFLMSSKLSEIGYLSSLVSPDVVSLVFDEHNKIMREEFLDIFVCALLEISFFVLFYIMHMVSSKHFWSYILLIPFFIIFVESFRHILHIKEECEKIKPFKQGFNLLQERIDKLSNEIKDMK